MVFEVYLLLVGFVAARNAASERPIGARSWFILLLTLFDMSRDHVITSSEIRIAYSKVRHEASGLRAREGSWSVA